MWKKSLQLGFFREGQSVYSKHNFCFSPYENLKSRTWLTYNKQKNMEEQKLLQSI